MNISAEPFGLPDDAPELARRFGVIMAGLGALIARRFLKMPHLSTFTVLLFSRLHRAVRRFHRALISPGRVRAPRARADRAAGARSVQPRLPSGRGWIVRELGWEAAAYLGYLEQLLAEIETQAALAEAPRAGRILRPICRMLGVPTALTPKTVPAALTPKIVPAALVPQMALKVAVQAGLGVAARISGCLQILHPGPLPKGEGEEEGQLSAPGLIFSGA